MNQKELNEDLIHACQKGDLSLVKKLVNDGADIHYKNNRTCTPFEMASIYGHLSILKWLYEHGADPTTDNNYAIRIASENGYLKVVKYLVSIGCDPTVKDNPAIQLASYFGYLEVVKYLHSIGCDPTGDYNYAIERASDRGHLEIVKFLALVGCDTDKITNPEYRKTAEYYKKYKPIMDQCIIEIYGHPELERTKTENEISFTDYRMN